MPSIVELLVKELDTELAGTRRQLEQVPEGKNSWKPHPKSMELGDLAAFTASMPGIMTSMLLDDTFDLANPGEYATVPAESTKALLAQFDKMAALLKDAVKGTSEQRLFTTHWKLTMKDQQLGNDLRYDAIRVGGINHLCHHRAQLGVYVRLNDGKVPGLYGPSADEPFEFKK